MYECVWCFDLLIYVIAVNQLFSSHEVCVNFIYSSYRPGRLTHMIYGTGTPFSADIPGIFDIE